MNYHVKSSNVFEESHDLILLVLIDMYFAILCIKYFSVYLYTVYCISKWGVDQNVI